MIKKFSFWVVFVVVVAIGSMVWFHRKTMQDSSQWNARIQPLYERIQVVDSLSLSLERYRRLSGSFRKIAPQEILTIKNRLQDAFDQGIERLEKLNPTPEERSDGNQLKDQIRELFLVIERVEPMLFSKDGYQKEEVQDVHEQIVKTLSGLSKKSESRLVTLRQSSNQNESRSLAFLGGMGAIICLAVLLLILRDHWVYGRPLKRLHSYAANLKGGKTEVTGLQLTGMHGEIQSSLNQLAAEVDRYLRDRHKFLLDIVTDLKSPLTLLQSGKFLLGHSKSAANEEKQIQAAEAVRRGLALVSGSLDDLQDIVDINLLESRLELKTTDLSELLSDVVRTLLGTEAGKRISLTVPPIPVWAAIDARRVERMLIQVLSKVLETLSPTGSLSVTLAQPNQGNFRGVEILVQDLERIRQGRTAAAGPDQDILKHWINEKGLGIALVHKIVKAHGGTITAAGVAGTSVAVSIRFPQESLMNRGLISPPIEAAAGLRASRIPELTRGSSIQPLSP